jgi:hypothetical protein
LNDLLGVRFRVAAVFASFMALWRDIELLLEAADDDKVPGESAAL